MSSKVLLEPVTLLVPERVDEERIPADSEAPSSSDLLRKFRNLAAAIAEEPIEDGVSHPAEQIIAAILKEHD